MNKNNNLWHVFIVLLTLSFASSVAQAEPSRDECLQRASTELFGVKLLCASRAELRAAMGKTKARVVREIDRTGSDVYQSGDYIVVVLFYHSDKFVGAKYTYKKSEKQPKYINLVKVLTRRYGEPKSSQGGVDDKSVSREWHTKDGASIKLYRQSNSGVINLAYFFSDRRKVMVQEQKAAQKR
ncbi:MAG: hypothetical protein OEL79_00890 [Chromatiales bacterium]|nr:hypothetical protein [Chromatiales bacterium]